MTYRAWAPRRCGSERPRTWRSRSAGRRSLTWSEVSSRPPAVNDDPKCPAAERFSLTSGGPFHRLLVSWGQKREERDRVVQRSMIAVIVTWLPLLVLSSAQGLALSERV